MGEDPPNTMPTMVDSWKLTTISMWFEKLDNEEVLKLIGDHFTWDELWEAAAELNELCKARSMLKQIPKNQDQGDLKDRVRILAMAVYGSLQELKNRIDKPVFVVSSAHLCNIPGVVKDRVQAEPAVTARLANIEKMVETLNKGFQELKSANISSKKDAFPTLQVNGAAASRTRSISASVKRTALQVAEEENQDKSQTELPWNLVARGNRGYSSRQSQCPTQGASQSGGGKSSGQGRRQRPVQHGTAQAQLAGSEAAPYNVVIGNTNPASAEDIIKNVLIHVSENMSEDSKLQEPLQISEIECLTKPREDGSRIWTKTWRVQVPAKFKDHMLRSDAYPAGWTCRRYFPPRAPREAVPELYPAGIEPTGKRPNLRADGTASLNVDMNKVNFMSYNSK